MAKQNSFEDWAKLYIDVANYNSLMQKYPNGKGDKTEVIPIALSEMVKQGLKDEDKETVVRDASAAYDMGDRSFFVRAVKPNYERAVNSFKEFPKEGKLESIVQDTPDEPLQKTVLPYVLKNYDGELSDLHEEIEKGKKELEEYHNPEKKKEKLDRLKEERLKYFEETYADNKELKDALIELLENSGGASLKLKLEDELQEKAKDFNDKAKRFKEALEGGDYKKYISERLTPEDAVKVYSKVYNDALEQAKKSQRQQGQSEERQEVPQESEEEE